MPPSLLVVLVLLLLLGRLCCLLLWLLVGHLSSLTSPSTFGWEEEDAGPTDLAFRGGSVPFRTRVAEDESDWSCEASRFSSCSFAFFSRTFWRPARMAKTMGDGCPSPWWVKVLSLKSSIWYPPGMVCGRSQSFRARFALWSWDYEKLSLQSIHMPSIDKARQRPWEGRIHSSNTCRSLTLTFLAHRRLRTWVFNRISHRISSKTAWKIEVGSTTAFGGDTAEETSLALTASGWISTGCAESSHSSPLGQNILNLRLFISITCSHAAGPDHIRLFKSPQLGQANPDPFIPSPSILRPCPSALNYVYFYPAISPNKLCVSCLGVHHCEQFGDTFWAKGWARLTNRGQLQSSTPYGVVALKTFGMHPHPLPQQREWGNTSYLQLLWKEWELSLYSHNHYTWC